MLKNKRSRACDIPQSVKKAVWERDHHHCVLCGNPYAMPNAHYISRFDGGLGVEKNIVTLCFECHRQYDQTTQRKVIKGELESYLKRCYEGWSEEELIYKQ